jgi:hypothetical protein
MHTVRALLVPDDVELPASAAPRSENQTDAGLPGQGMNVQPVTSKDLFGTLRLMCMYMVLYACMNL